MLRDFLGLMGSLQIATDLLSKLEGSLQMARAGLRGCSAAAKHAEARPELVSNSADSKPSQ